MRWGAIVSAMSRCAVAGTTTIRMSAFSKVPADLVHVGGSSLWLFMHFALLWLPSPWLLPLICVHLRQSADNVVAVAVALRSLCSLRPFPLLALLLICAHLRQSADNVVVVAVTLTSAVRTLAVAVL